MLGFELVDMVQSSKEIMTIARTNQINWDFITERILLMGYWTQLLCTQSENNIGKPVFIYKSLGKEFLTFDNAILLARDTSSSTVFYGVYKIK